MGESKRGKVRLSALKRLMVCAIIFSLVFPGAVASGYASTISADSNTGSAGVSTRNIDIDQGLIPNNGAVISETSWKLAPGITETELVTNIPNGNRQEMEYICTIDPNETTAKIVASYKDQNPEKWGLQNITAQAKAYQAQHPDERVVAAINGDYFNMSTGEPAGALVMNGTVYHNTGGKPYFAILKDGTPVIREANVPLDDVQEAVGAHDIILKDGNVVNEELDTRSYARNVIGIKADGTIVSIVSHGVNPPISHGRTVKESAQMLKAMGCVWGARMDEGGSANLSTRREGESMDEFTMRNSGQDGTERNVSSAFLLVSTAKADGEFDHFSISPNNMVYTQYSSVQFEAQAVDFSGEKIDDSKIPEGITWALGEGSEDLGTIDQNGKFTSNGKEGEVTVNKVTKDGEIVGSTVITICAPDEITWQNDEISLGFSDSSDLGLIVRWKNREVIVKDGDFNWKITPDEGYEEYIGREDEIGTFDGNIFTSGDEATVNAMITATYAHTGGASSSVHAIIGMLPSIVMDFESKDDVDAKDYWSIDKAIFNSSGGTIMALTDDWKNARKGSDGKLVTTTDKVLLVGQYCNSVNSSSGVINGRGGNSSAEIVTIGDGEPVRFGNSSLKLNYDFSNINGTEGACIGFSQQTQEIEGNPTGIGMWVYAPEGTPNLWLRIRVLDGQNNVVNLNFTDSMKDAMNASGNTDYGGINWTGWKYVEADLTDYQGPFKLIGGETIRLMHTAGSGGVTAGEGNGDFLADGTKISRADCKGSIYIDNLRFVYGANVDDTLSPVIDSITANDEEIQNNGVINTNTINFRSTFHDAVDKYVTGIDYETVYVYIDGKDVSTGNDDNYHLIEADNELRLDEVVLNNGTHKIKVLLRDGFGNETVEERTFVVDGNEDLPSIYFDMAGAIPTLNQEFDLLLKSSDIANTQAVSASVNLREEYLNGVNVTFNDEFDGSYEVKDGKLVIKAERKTQADQGFFDIFRSNEGVIATIKCKVPSDVASGSKFTYSATDGTIELVAPYDGEGNLCGTFSVAEESADVNESLHIEMDNIEVGLPDQGLYVYDAQDKPVAGANIYNANTQEVVGTTDEQGYFDVTELLAQNVEAYSLYAEKDGEYSFRVNGQSFAIGGDESGKPVSVSAMAAPGGGNDKVFTWISNPHVTADTPVLQIAKKSDYDKNGEKAFKDYTGESSIQYFTASAVISENKVARVNEVKVSGLEQEKEYVYRVGDGEAGHWSDISTFKVPKVQGDVNMFIIGDAQTSNTDVIDQINDSLTADGKEYALGIQTGDLIENGGLYNDWIGGLNLFSDMKDTDMLHVVGNHEIYGDTYGDIAEKIFAQPNKKYYSVEYGNVYVATISYSDSRDQYDEAFKWLEEDAAKSDCQWKILVMHQPAYYTNAEGGNGYVHDNLPQYAEKAGIDFVFSGHDHAYARTEPLKGGDVADDGVVYYICGSTGEKAYPVSINEDFHFVKAHNDYTAIYLTLSATDEKLTVETHEADGSVIDTYTKYSDNECAESGHSYVYDGTYLACEKCGYERDIKGYTGWAADKDSGSRMYFINGSAQKGWTHIGEEVCYFDKEGLELEVELKTDIKTNCTVRGYKLYECKAAPSGEREFRVNYPLAPGHEYEEVDGEMVCSVCGHVRINMSDCSIILGNTDFTYTGKPIEPIFRVTAMKDGKEITLKNGADYYATIEDDNTNVGEVTMRFTAQKVGIYVDVNEWRGNCAGSVDVTFTIHPELPRSATVIDNGTYATLSWAKSESAQQYVIYQSKDGGAYKEIATTTDTTYVVTGMSESSTYKYRIGTRAVADGKTIDSILKLIPKAENAELTIENRDSDGKPVIKVNDWNENAKYEVYRSTRTAADSFQLIGSLTKDGYADTDVQVGQLYYYKVKVTSADGSSEFTGIYVGTPSCEHPTITAGDTTDEGKPYITWNPVTGAKEYKVYVSENGEDDKYKLAWTGSDTTYIDSQAQAGKTYSYKVKAVSETGVESAFSEPTSVKCMPGVPQIKNTDVNNDGKPSIEWNKVEGADKYEILRAESKDGNYTKIGETKEFSYTDTSAEAGKTYYFKVKVVAGDTSATSEAASVSCPILAPVIQSAGLNESGNPVITWGKVAGASKYEILRAEEENGTYNTLTTTTETTYTDVNVSAENTYYYKVRAIGVDSNITSESKTAAVTTEAEPIVVERISGANRYETAVASANALKEEYGIDKFDNLIVANGDNYVDALAGSYLAKVKNAPILLVNQYSESYVKDYITSNVNAGGTIYLLGGEGVVSKQFENSLTGFSVERLGGRDRFETNIAILQEAGMTGEDVLVCSAWSFADSLSAASAGKPILLVDDDLNAVQEEFVSESGAQNYYLIGGTSVVSNNVQNALNGYGNVKRIAGANRYATSKAVADKFFPNGSKAAVIASGMSFPDGLTGGPLASSMSAPILLVNDYNTDLAKEFIDDFSIKDVKVIGGSGAVSDAILDKITE